MTHRLAILGGDGIGPEVVAAALRVMEAAGVVFESTEYDLGYRRYERTGEVLHDDTMNELAGYDAILLGAVGDPRFPAGVIERGLLLKMRFAFDQYINLRPFKGGGRDFVVVRENTEGLYAGEGGFLRKGTPNEIATQGSVNTRLGVERCVRFAYEYARTRPAKHLTLIHKTNVLTFSGDLWARVFQEVGEEYPDVTTGYDHIDAACIHLVEHPDRYDTIVTDNLFGDILTDLAGAVAGGIGLAASGNLRPEKDRPSMFEPAHGSAPDIVGTGKANPLATIRSAAMLCDFLGEHEAAARMTMAVDRVLDAGTVGNTGELADAVITQLQNPHQN